MARPTRRYGPRRQGALRDAAEFGEAAYLVDANNYIFRAFHGIPPFTTEAGRPTNATYGFLRTLLMLARERRPTWAAAVFDGGVSFRSDLLPSYKQNRVEPPADLALQFPDCRRGAAAIGFACLEATGYEADDLMGTLAIRLRDQGTRVVLVSGDKDLAQLVGEGITLYDVARDEEFSVEKVVERFGVRPAQIPDLLALSGDAIDNIPGIHGIGEKTAVVLLKAFGSLEAILERPERIESLAVRNARGIREKIVAAREAARLARELASIARDVPFHLDLEALRYRGAHRDQVESLFTELHFGTRIRSEIPLWSDDQGPLFAGMEDESEEEEASKPGPGDAGPQKSLF